MPSKIIALPLPDTSCIVSIAAIKLLDARYDTSVVVLLKSAYLSLENDDIDKISKHLKSAFIFDTTSEHDVCIYIKSLWLSNELELIPEQSGGRKNEKKTWKQEIMFKAEVFVTERGYFYPLFRLDPKFTTNDNTK